MVQLDGFHEAIVEELRDKQNDLGREAIEAWVEHTNSILRTAPVGIGAPRSAEEWNLEAIADSAEIRQEGDRWVAEWTAETDDGQPLIDIFEFGTDPYLIEGDPVLRWTDDETGEVIFAARVRHPGIPEVAAVRIGRGHMEMEIADGTIEP